ncbi:MAG: glutamine amidotransferase-related protein, partial [Rhodospirillales bacterium]
EFGPCKEAVVGLMTEWMKKGDMERRGADGDLGGTMRLGAYDARLTKGSKVFEIYGGEAINERHRHRYEVNSNYIKKLEQVGVKFSGMSPDGTLPEIVEIPDHPWFIGVQYHPELKSKPFDPHPLFTSFIEAAVQQSRLV